MGGEYYNKYVKNQSYEVMLALAKDNLCLTNHLIILDGFFGDKLSSPLISTFMKNRGFETKVIYFCCSLDVNKQRIMTRDDPRDHNKFANFEEYYQKTMAIHDKELASVPHILINTEDPLERNLDLILGYLKD